MAVVLNSYHIDKFWKIKRYQKLFPVPLPFHTQVCNCSGFSSKITKNRFFLLVFLCFTLQTMALDRYENQKVSVHFK